MGGQNHQPTSSIRLIAPSAWLSQKLGQGFTAVLQANNELENAIIVAVKHLHVEEFTKGLTNSASSYLDRTIDHLRASLQKTAEIRAAYKHLLNAATLEGYKGNPLASKIGGFSLAHQFEGTLVMPAVNTAAWKSVEDRIGTTNILCTLEWESSEFSRLHNPTTELMSIIEAGQKILQVEGDRAFIEAVEWNKLPLRQSYARVFSLWNHLHAMFLYSALMMTELFYRSNGHPSLLETDSTVSRQVA